MTGRYFIGVSGWRYAPWRGHFYPEGLRQADELAWLSRAFPSVEVNGSFYSLQSPASWATWAAAVPDGFVFAVKGPRFLTHVLRLRDTRTGLANFLASGVLSLGAKLGPLLWQLPPNFAYDRAVIDGFLRSLPRTTTAAWTLACDRDAARMRGRENLARPPAAPLRHALEVRHPSFVDRDFIALLRHHGVAAVLADTPEPWPVITDVTADFVYLRLHGAAELYKSRYDAPALRDWARRARRFAAGGHEPAAGRIEPALDSARAGGRDVYGYFDNTDKRHAPENAGQMVALLGVAPRLQDGAPIGW